MDVLRDYTEEIATCLRETAVTRRDGTAMPPSDALEEWGRLCKIVRDDKGGVLWFIGNGASATISEHMSLDAMKAGRFKTGSCSETSYLTAICNDISSDDLFAFKLDRQFSAADMLITTSSSGNSPNIIKAIEVCRAKGGIIVTLSAMKPDNKSRKLGDLNFFVPAKTYGLAEVCHAGLLHCWFDLFLDKYEGGRR
jgi:D-sedoheptulose 7-phosphate isomerase